MIKIALILLMVSSGVLAEQYQRTNSAIKQTPSLANKNVKVPTLKREDFDKKVVKIYQCNTKSQDGVYTTNPGEVFSGTVNVHWSIYRHRIEMSPNVPGHYSLWCEYRAPLGDSYVYMGYHLAYVPSYEVTCTAIRGFKFECRLK